MGFFATAGRVFGSLCITQRKEERMGGLLRRGKLILLKGGAGRGGG